MRRVPTAARQLADLLRQARAQRLPPALTVVASVYAGLGGVTAIGLLMAITLTPIGPTLQLAGEPARQAVINLVQPPAAAVVVVGAPTPRVEVPETPAPVPTAGDEQAAAPDDLNTLIAEPMDASPVPDLSNVQVPSHMYVPSSTVAESVAPTDQDVGPTDGEDEDEVPEVSQPSAAESAVVRPAETSALQTPGQDLQPLSSIPAPIPTSTETPQQVKAREEMANQGAIDAAKADQVRAKATADAANQAAIDARRAAQQAAATLKAQADTANDAAIAAARTTVTPTLIPAQTPAGAAIGATVGTSIPPTATAKENLTRAQAEATNQAVIDTTRAAKVRAKATANAANEAAIDAARLARAGRTVTPTPVPTPLASPTEPSASAPQVRDVPDEPPAVVTDGLNGDDAPVTDPSTEPAVPELPEDKSAAD